MSEPAGAADRPLIYTEEELLAGGDYEAPLLAGGVRCHGGFLADGRYRSPRTLHRGGFFRTRSARSTIVER